MLKKLISLVILVFLLGWLSHAFYDSLAAARAEPVLTDTAPPAELKAPPAPPPAPVLEAKKAERAEPEPRPVPDRATRREWIKLPDWLTPDQVHVTRNRVTIDAKPGYEFETSIFSNTDSMLPVLDEHSQAIQVKPKSEKDIKEGMIISYDAGPYGTIIHRVIRIGHDEQGWYAIVKGDNNPSPDPFKVRFSQIKHFLVAVIQ